MPEETKWLKKETVVEYAERHLQIEKLEKEEKEDRERIIKLMKKGYDSPEGLPYKLVLGNQERHPISWKDEWMVLARRLLKKTWRQEMKAIVDNAEQINTPTLSVKPAVASRKNVIGFKKTA